MEMTYKYLLIKVFSFVPELTSMVLESANKPLYDVLSKTKQNITVFLS